MNDEIRAMATEAGLNSPPKLREKHDPVEVRVGTLQCLNAHTRRPS